MMEIRHNDVLLAKMFSVREITTSGLTFLSSESDLLQTALWTHSKDTFLTSHIHNDVRRETSGTSEVVVVLSGRIHADIYSVEEELIDEIELVAGSILMCLEGGHGYKIMENHTVVLEIKNGPYFGVQVDKRSIPNRCKLIESGG